MFMFGISGVLSLINNVNLYNLKILFNYIINSGPSISIHELPL